MMKLTRRTCLIRKVAIYIMIMLTLYVATSPIYVRAELTGTVSGRVMDEYDQGMRNVEIKVYSSDGAYIRTSHTSSDGSFALALGIGRGYTLHFWKEGYARVTKGATLKVYQEEVKLGDIVLLKALRLFYKVLSLVASPGDLLMLPFAVSNIGDETEIVEFSVTEPEDWETRILGQIGEVTRINLEGGESLDLQLEVVIPETAIGSNDLSLVAAGKTTSTLDFTVLVDTGEVDYKETKIMCTEPWQVLSTGSSAAFDLSVENNFKDDIYLLYIENPSLPNGNWTASFYSGTKNVRSIGIEALEDSLLTLLVEVPKEAAPDDYPFRVYASGSYSITSIVLTITVRSVPRKIDLVYPFQSQTALTDQSLSYPIKVVNEGEQTEKIFLGINRTAEMLVWDVSFSDNELTLDPKGAEWVTLSVKPPGVVEAGIYSMNVTASTEDGELKRVIPIVTEIVADYILEIVDIQPINPQVASGEKIDALITVRNIGQSPVTRIRLEVNATAISNIYTTPVDILALEPMSSVSYYVSISPQIRLTPGDYLVEVQAESLETQSGVRGFVVSVVSPIPWFWISIAITIIATTLAIIVIERLASKYGIRIQIRR